MAIERPLNLDTRRHIDAGISRWIEQFDSAAIEQAYATFLDARLPGAPADYRFPEALACQYADQAIGATATIGGTLATVAAGALLVRARRQDDARTDEHEPEPEPTQEANDDGRHGIGPAAGGN